MRRAAATALAALALAALALAALALAAPAHAGNASTSTPQEAHEAVNVVLRVTLKPLLENTRAAKIAVLGCARRGCEFRVRGQSLSCRGFARARETANDYFVWISRLECRP